jgi:hypothetical protein
MGEVSSRSAAAIQMVRSSQLRDTAIGAGPPVSACPARQMSSASMGSLANGAHHSCREKSRLSGEFPKMSAAVPAISSRPKWPNASPQHAMYLLPSWQVSSTPHRGVVEPAVIPFLTPIGKAVVGNPGQQRARQVVCSRKYRGSRGRRAVRHARKIRASSREAEGVNRAAAPEAQASRHQL